MPEWMKIRKEGVEIGENIPSYVYYITNGAQHILVDTSFSSEQDILSHLKIYCRREKAVNAQLAEIGVLPEEIDTVIFTHLHWDHAGGFLGYKNARLIVQKKEFEWMRLNYQWDIGYPDWVTEQLLDHESHFELVDGNMVVAPGVEILFNPGHTPGSQMVKVETEVNTVIIPGDNIMSFDNLKAHKPIGMFCDLVESVRSLEIVALNHALCLPSHDWRTKDVVMD
jgi:glyoxylase-like metal-dependent hydrolase (beta-lactamase superfamily II)